MPHPIGPRLKILYVITSLDLGGEERHLLHLARFMRDAGHDVRVCCLRRRGVIARILDEAGIPVTCFDEGERPAAGRLLRNAWRLGTVMKEQGIDVVHSFLVRANVETRIAKRMADAGCVLVNSEGCINLHKPPGAVWLDRATVRWCDLVIANCRAVADVLGARERVPPSKIRLVYQGIDVGAFTRAATSPIEGGAVAGDVVVGYVGRLDPEKDVATLVEAASLTARVTKALRVVIVGDGKDAGPLKALVGERGLGDVVSFAGRQVDIAGFMRTFDILAIPSREEGLPTVAIEALACGVPVVATAVGGTPEVIEHGRTGLLVPPGNAARLAEALLTLVRDKSFRRELGRNGPKVASARFQLARMLTQTAAVYDAALKASRQLISPAA